MGEPKKRSKKPLIIALVAVVVLALAITGGLLWNRHSKEQAAIRAEQERQTRIEENEQGAIGAATEYFEALGAHDAEKALSLGTETVDSPAATSEMLAATYPEGLSDVQAELTSDLDDNAISAEVEVTFTPTGQEPKTSIITLTKDSSTDAWQLNQPTTFLYVPNDTLVKLNGIAMPAGGDLDVFPGTYAVTPTNQHLTTAEGNEPVEVYNFTEGADFTGSFELSDKAVAAFQAAAKKSIEDCMTKKELNPEGCPWKITESNGIDVDESSIKWTLEEDKFSELDPGYIANTNTAADSLVFKMSLSASATQNGNRGTTGTEFTAGGGITGDLSKEVITVTWDRY